MESSQTIEDTITIYKEWLFGEHQVKVLNENRKKYLNIMLDHLSLIFTRRECSSQQQIHQMISFCDKVLDIYDLALKDEVVDLQNLTMLLIGSIHSIAITPKQQQSQPVVSANKSSSFYKTKEKKLNLSEEVSGRLINTLYRCWIKYVPKEELLWKTLMKYHKQWSILLPVAKEWKIMMKSLTESVMKQLYEKTECIVTIDGKKENTEVINTIDPQYAYNFWITCLHCIGNPILSNNSKVFETIISAFHEQIELMIANKCSGETILRVYNILYQCVILPNHLKFEEGVSVAMKTLINIYKETVEYTTFTQQSLNQMYLTLSYALSSESEKVLLMGIEGYIELMKKSFVGIEMLAKTVLYSVHRASLLKDSVFNEHYNKFIEIISTLLSYTNIKEIIFTPFQTEDIENKHTVQSLLVINLYILLKHQTNPEHIHNVLVLINRFFIEQLKINQCNETFTLENIKSQAPRTVGEFAWYFIKLVQYYHNILFVSSKPEIHRMIFTIMKTLITQYKYIPDGKKFLDEMFIVLNELITNWMKSKNLVVLGDSLSVLTVYCQEILPIVTKEQMTKISELYKKLVMIQGYDAKRDLVRMSVIPSEGIEYFTMLLSQSITTFYQSFMMNHPTFGSKLINCQLNEKNLFALFNKFEINEPTEILNYMYIVAVENTSILSFIELPFKNIKGEKQFLVLARDPKGRNGYLISLKEHDYEMNVIETELPEFTIERNRLNDIVLSDEKIKEELTKIENLNASQIEQFVSQSLEKYELPQQEQIEKVTYKDVQEKKHGSKFAIVRLFLSTMGFCSSNYWKRLTPLKVDMKLIEKLDEIDMISSRNHMTINIINHEDGNTNEFVSFIQQLGEVRYTTGYEGQKEGYEKEEKMISYQDENNDIIYHIKGILPFDENVKSEIEIHWGEYEKENKEVEEETQLIISIKQMKESLYEIDCNKTITTLIPHQKAFITSLGYVVRENCIGYIEKKNLEELNFAFDLRCVTLQEITREFKVKENEMSLLEMLFDKSLVEGVSVENLINVGYEKK